jgi:hypothetical protein
LPIQKEFLSKVLFIMKETPIRSDLQSLIG